MIYLMPTLSPSSAHFSPPLSPSYPNQPNTANFEFYGTTHFPMKYLLLTPALQSTHPSTLMISQSPGVPSLSLVSYSIIFHQALRSPLGMYPKLAEPLPSIYPSGSQPLLILIETVLSLTHPYTLVLHPLLELMVRFAKQDQISYALMGLAHSMDGLMITSSLISPVGILLHTTPSAAFGLRTLSTKAGTNTGDAYGMQATYFMMEPLRNLMRTVGFHALISPTNPPILPKISNLPTSLMSLTRYLLIWAFHVTAPRISCSATQQLTSASSGTYPPTGYCISHPSTCMQSQSGRHGPCTFSQTSKHYTANFFTPAWC